MIKRFVWWWCRVGHCKIYSDRMPICPVCRIPMDEGEMMSPPKEDHVDTAGNS